MRRPDADGHHGGAERYGWDALGNPQGETVDAGNRLRTLASALGSWSLSYDDEGNLVSKSRGGQTTTFQWNALGQLVSVTDASGTTTFTYDALGRRIRAAGPAGTTQFVLDGANVVADANASGTIQRYYSYYDGVAQLHSMRMGSTGYVYQRDLTGNVMGLIRTSDGAIAATYDYTPFGVTTDNSTYVANTNRFRFASGEQDATGLYYFRNRYYDPELRRWFSEDPIGLQGGINLYAYVGNDPVNYRDPWGLQEECPPYATPEGPDGECIVDHTYGIGVSVRRLVEVSLGGALGLGRGYGLGQFVSRVGDLFGYVRGGVTRVSDFAYDVAACVDEGQRLYKIGESELPSTGVRLALGGAAAVLTGEALGGQIRLPRAIRMPQLSRTFGSAVFSGNRASNVMSPRFIARGSLRAVGSAMGTVSVTLFAGITAGGRVMMPYVCAAWPSIYD